LTSFSQLFGNFLLDSINQSVGPAEGGNVKLLNLSFTRGNFKILNLCTFETGSKLLQVDNGHLKQKLSEVVKKMSKSCQTSQNTLIPW